LWDFVDGVFAMSERQSFGGTQWFALSGREVLVLLLGVGLVALAIGAAHGAEWLWGRGRLAVAGAGDAPFLPPRMNVNTAAEHELALLPGIGPHMAALIVQHRNENGPFATFEGLLAVKGIGPKTLERIRPHAMCAPVPPAPPPAKE
jgi:competence ComEA-like helix-hairpin-helix protein